MSKHGNWYSGKIGDGDFGACKLQGSRRTIWGPVSKFHCDLGDLFHYLWGLGHSSLFICFKDVGGKIVGNSGDCSQLQALPKSYSHLNFKKQQKQSCVRQATSMWPELGPCVQFDICYGAGSLWDRLCLRGQFTDSEVLVTCPQASLVQAPGCLWLACQEGLSYRLTLSNHLDGKEAVGSGSFRLSPEQNSFVGFPGWVSWWSWSRASVDSNSAAYKLCSSRRQIAWPF